MFAYNLRTGGGGVCSKSVKLASLPPPCVKQLALHALCTSYIGFTGEKYGSCTVLSKDRFTLKLPTVRKSRNQFFFQLKRIFIRFFRKMQKRKIFNNNTNGKTLKIYWSIFDHFGLSWTITGLVWSVLNSLRHSNFNIRWIGLDWNSLDYLRIARLQEHLYHANNLGPFTLSPSSSCDHFEDEKKKCGWSWY